MNRCDNYSMAVQLYLDNELAGSAHEFFLTHLSECFHCRQQLESEQLLSNLLRRTHPLYSASEELRARVQSTVPRDFAAARNCRFGFRKRAVQYVQQPIKIVSAVAAGFAAIALVLSLAPYLLQRVRAAEYVETAVSAHRDYLQGKLPLQFSSNSPAEVVAFFTGKVPFLFQLPASQLTAKVDPAFRLTGGRVVSFAGGRAALVAYHSRTEQISLLVASSESATAAGGDELRAHGSNFYFTSKGGFNVVTWTSHGLTYALVSSLHGSAQHSCLVCHQNLGSRNEVR